MKLGLRALCTVATLAMVACVLGAPSAVGQVAGQNVNMVSGTKWPTGDPFLQRQNEPSMAVSTRNPMHILAGANDYRSVDLEQVLSGGAETGDAWLGLFKSFDGGFTWQSNLLPGCPYTISQCTDSGALNGRFQAAADPVVRAGTNGMFFYAGLAFDRATSATTASSVSSVFVARYNDLNNNEQADPITYIDTHIAASGNSTQFLDKPSMAVDIPRSGAGTCSFTANEPGLGANGGPLAVKESFPAGAVYLAYTDFLAATKANSTPTHLMITHSTDCGVTWSTPIQINTGTTTSQGSAIAVNPITGAVYVAWRQFASTGISNAIMIAQSTNAGKTFSTPVQISTFQPFDQGTTGTSFRTNAYPALTTDMFGFVYVAFSARGVSSSGDARVVAAGSLDGTHWTPAIMVDNPAQNAQTNPSGRGHQIMPAMTFANGRLTLLYYDLRLDHYAGFYTPNTASLGNYKEMLEPQGELAPPSPMPSEVFTTYIDDAGLTLRRHTLDLRVLELGIFPTVTLGPSVLVSQYDFGCCVNPETEDIEQFKFNPPNLPLFDEGQEAFLGDYIDIVPSPAFLPSGSSWVYNFMPSVNPLFHATWTDNRDVVPPPPGKSWEYYTAPVVAGAISVETGQPLPACISGQEGMRNQNIYTSQITGGLVVGAPGNSKPLGTTTFNGKTVPFQRAFPVEAQNSTASPLNVRFTISNQPTGGVASFLQFSTLTTLDVTVPAYSSVSRSVFATSTSTTASITVNVAQISAIGGSVVTNGLSSTAVLNPDITNPNITNPNITNPNITNPNITNAEVTNPNITNPNITNPDITNPNITNPNITNASYLNPNITNPNITNLNVDNISATNPNITNPNITNPNITNPNITNPNITNPNITNPDITNGSIQDVTYPITNNGNTTASYTVKAASGITIPGGIVLQLLINKLYQTPVAVNCVLGVQTHWITVANITNPKVFGASDSNLTNPDITNSTPNEASVTLAPGETAYITVRVVNPSPATIAFNPVTGIAPVSVPQAVNTTTVLANPGNPSLTAPPAYPPVTVLTTSLPATDRLDPGYAVQLQAGGGKPGTDTWTIASGTPPPGITVSASGLVSGQATTPGSYTFTIQAADSATPANTASQAFTLNVSVTPLTVQTVMPPPDGVVGQSYVATTLTVIGGTGPYIWTATGLPPGLVISPTSGQITGIPTVANTNGSNVTITATDSAFPPESTFYSPTIPVGAVIQITPPTLPAGVIGVPYSAQLSATGGIGGLVFATPSPAPGVVLGANGGLTIANPQTPTLSFSISVHDQAQPTFQYATANYTITFGGQVGGHVTFLTQPANSVGGQVLSGSPVNVFVSDASNAAIMGANVTMSFNGTPACASATLGGTLTVQTDANGTAHFTNLTVDHGQIGYTLNANVAGLSAISNPFNVSGFCETGNMNAARRNHMVIALNNGKILVTGGAANADGTGGLASAELYDPVAHTFTTISPMNSARVDHTVTLLLNGTVLVAGGYDQTGNVVQSAEIFNPATNTFTLLSAPMTSQRAEHAATLLAGGQVLLTGGNSNTTTLGTAEIYDPVAQTFTATSHPMNAVRQAQHADILPNGTVLVSGGLDNNNNPIASAEIYTPTIQTFTLTGSMTTARGNHSSALLYTGKVLVAGGLAPAGAQNAITATAEVYDPSTGLFTPTENMSIARGHYAGIVLNDGTIFISGGAPLPAGTNADVYNPATGTFSTTGNFTAVQAGGREAVAPDGTVLLASGVNITPVTVPNSELYYPVPLAPGIVITTPPTFPNAIAGQRYSQVILEHGGVGQLNWSTDLSPNILVMTSNGVLTGNPSFTGSFSFHITVTDSSTPPQTTTVPFSLQVNGGLSILTTTLPAGLVGTPYNSPIASTGGVLPVSFSLATASFPPGLTITQPGPGSQTGALAGTPTTPGTYTFNESVADSSSPQQMATQAYSVQVFSPLAITTTTLPGSGTDAGSPAITYSAQIQISGGPGGGITYSIISGTLPAGITLNPATGALSATSVTGATGIYNFTVQAVSSGPLSNTATAALSITLYPFFNGNTPNTLPAGTVGTPYSTVISSSGGVVPYSYNLVQGTLPQGLSFNSPTSTTITLSGTPTAAGTSNFIISASDTSVPPQGYTEALGVTINPAGPAPIASMMFTTQPVNSIGGQGILSPFPAVKALDAGSNPVMGANITMSLGTNACTTESGVTLGGATTVATDATGTATFFGLRIASAGSPGFTLLATAPSAVTATSATFLNAGSCNLASQPHGTRSGATTTLLQDGTILITGGEDPSGIVATAEIYNPTTGVFTPTNGPMTSPRAQHRATLLSNGQVLITGGNTNLTGGVSNTLEFYNPATGTFSLFAGITMNSPRVGHTQTLLSDGASVLIAGGYNGTNPVGTAQIYINGTLGAGINMVTARNQPSATLLSSGNVLLAGGFTPANPTGAGDNTAETYNPSTQIFTATAGNMINSHVGHTATLLNPTSGIVLIAGGENGSLVQSINASELYSPITNSFTATGSLIAGRSQHTATLLPNGKVLMAGGWGVFGDGENIVSELYDPVAGTFSTNAYMQEDRVQHGAVLLSNGTVLLVGGTLAGYNAIEPAEIYYPAP